MPPKKKRNIKEARVEEEKQGTNAKIEKQESLSSGREIAQSNLAGFLGKSDEDLVKPKGNATLTNF